MNWSERYAIAQYNYQYSPTLQGTDVYDNILGKVNKFYANGGTVELHHFDHSKGSFRPNFIMSNNLADQAARIIAGSSENDPVVKQRAHYETAWYLKNASRFYRKGRFPLSYSRQARKDGRSTVFGFTRDKDGNITAAMSGYNLPDNPEAGRCFVMNGVASTQPGHASVLQHALLHHVTGENIPVLSQVYNRTTNYNEKGEPLPWTDDDQTQQDRALQYHRSIGRRISPETSGNINSFWSTNDTTRLIRNTRTKTNVKNFFNR
jgi:hypothetical protein